MIQFKRGSKKNWLALKKPLAAGQPGYDKDKHKIKIGNGKDLWAALPYASGLSAKEIFNNEADARDRNIADKDDTTIITYGKESPDKNTVGQLYLQYYDTDPEADYVVSSGVDREWTYQKWKSGVAKCWCTISLDTKVDTALGKSGLFYDNKKMKSIYYPFTFSSTPSETATIQSPGWLVWLAGNTGNTSSKSGIYSLISTEKQSNAKYTISIQVEGFWK